MLERCCWCCLPSADRQVFERFRVQHHVKYGKGAFGTTYLAYDLEDEGQSVAAKRVAMPDSTPEAVQREVDIMRSLSHPNIVHLLGSCRIDDGSWIFMELLESGDLFAEVERLGFLSEARAVNYTRQLMHGVAYCHAHGVVHRDLKLENLMLTRDGCLKIIDFGLAWAFQRRPFPGWREGRKGGPEVGAAAEEAGAAEEGDAADEYEVTPLYAVCGSRAYCAPEVLRRSAGGYGARVDVYSCGVCLFAMLLGFFPLEEASPRDWRYAKLRDAQAAGMDTVGSVLQWYGRANPLSDHASELLHTVLRVLEHALLREGPGLMGPHGVGPAYRGAVRAAGKQLEPARSFMRRLTGHSLSGHLHGMLEGRRSPAEVLEASGRVLLPRSLTLPDRTAPTPLPARLPVYRAAALNYLRGAGNGERLPVYTPEQVRGEMRDVVERHGMPMPPALRRCKRFGQDRRHGQDRR